MNDDTVLRLETRRSVYRFVSRNPGSHLREIARSVQLPLGTALYHLNCLEDADRVTITRDGRYKRYFLKHALGRREKEYVSALHHAVPRAIVYALAAKGARTQRELSRDANVSRSTLSFHVNRLVNQGILSCEDQWPENRYHLAEPTLTKGILERYAHAFPRTGNGASSITGVSESGGDTR